MAAALWKPDAAAGPAGAPCDAIPLCCELRARTLRLRDAAYRRPGLPSGGRFLPGIIAGCDASPPGAGLGATRASGLAAVGSPARGRYPPKRLYLSQVIEWHSHATCSSTC